jgi:hypothetical protein
MSETLKGFDEPKLESPDTKTEAVSFLKKQGAVFEEEGMLILDSDKLTGIKGENSRHKTQGDNISKTKLADVLLALHAVEKKDLDVYRKDRTKSPSARPVIQLPTNKNAALHGEFDNQGMVTLEKFYHNTPWGKNLKLTDGSEFNYAELFIS